MVINIKKSYQQRFFATLKIWLLRSNVLHCKCDAPFGRNARPSGNGRSHTFREATHFTQ